MKVETTVELPEELLAAMDERSDEYGGRSELVEAALRALIEGALRRRAERGSGGRPGVPGPAVRRGDLYRVERAST
jgi:metal-responsive CopG/Arc/MetJ family transcriptional regulator